MDHRSRRATLLSGLCLLALPILAATPPDEVHFPAGPYTLHGCIWKPAGNGPFPTIIYNHGSEPEPFPCGPPQLAAFYQEQGWAFFAFQRHGHKPSPGPYILDLQKAAFQRHPTDRPSALREAVALQELYNLDVEAAVAWLKQQPSTDQARVVMTGISFGGIQTLLTAEKGLGIRAFLPFAPAAMSWNPILAARLKTAIAKATAPIFIIQAQNDYSLEPSKVLGTELAKKGAPNQAKIYPPFGSTTQQAHAWFGSRTAGIAIWSPDVLTFLQTAINTPAK